MSKYYAFFRDDRETGDGKHGVVIVEMMPEGHGEVRDWTFGSKAECNAKATAWLGPILEVCWTKPKEGRA